MFGENENYQSEANEFHRKRISVGNVLSTVVVLLLFVGMFYMGHFATNKVTGLNFKNQGLTIENEKLKEENNKIKSENQTLFQEKLDLEKMLSEATQRSKEDELRLLGIHPEKIQIKKISLSGNWQAATNGYELSAIYMANDISDLGKLRLDNNDLSNSKFLLLEIDVTDKRESGFNQIVPITQYISVVEGNIGKFPFTDDYLTLPPGGSSKYYVGLAVSPAVNKFELRSGLTQNPIITNINFEDESVNVIEGVLTLKNGYSSEYIMQ